MQRCAESISNERGVSIDEKTRYGAQHACAAQRGSGFYLAVRSRAVDMRNTVRCALAAAVCTHAIACTFASRVGSRRHAAACALLQTAESI